MLTTTTHLWSRDHIGTWKKRPPNLLSTSFLPDKSLYLVVHSRSSSDYVIPFPGKFPDLSPHTLCRDGVSHKTTSKHKLESHYSASYKTVPTSFPSDKLNTSVLHDCRSSTPTPVCSFSLPRLSDSFCRSGCLDSRNGTSKHGQDGDTRKQHKPNADNQITTPSHPPQLRRPLHTEVARLIIPYLGVNVCILLIVITRHAVCRLLITYKLKYFQICIFIMTYLHQRHHTNQPAGPVPTSGLRRESNLQHHDSDALHYYVITLVYYVKFLLVSSSLCTPASETRKTLGGRKKLLLGWSLSTVPPPSPDEDTTPPRTRVLDLKSHRIYSNDLSLLTSGMCSTEQLVHYVYTRTSHDHYTLDESRARTRQLMPPPPPANTCHPQDGDETSGGAGRQRSSDSTSSTGSQRSKIHGRKPLANRHHPYRISNSNGDDEEDDEDPSRSRNKIPSRCELDSNEPTLDRKTAKQKKRASLPCRIEIKGNDELNATQVVTDKPNASMMSETSFFGIIGTYARSWIVGPNPNGTISEDNGVCPSQGLDTPITNNNLDLSPSRLNTTMTTQIPEITVHSPKENKLNNSMCDRHSDNLTTPKGSEPSKDAYFTGFGDPTITPVPRIKSRGMQQTLKTLLHTPSLSPRQVVQEKHRTRRHSFSNRITEAAPKVTDEDIKAQNRPRHISEGDVASLKANNTDGRLLQYDRYQIQGQGLHKCDGHSFELSDRSFLEGSEISIDSVQSEIKVALREVSPEITPGQAKSSCTELFWRPSVVKALCNDLTTGLPPNTPSPGHQLRTKIP